jgi:hypothetical protein
MEEEVYGGSKKHPSKPLSPGSPETEQPAYVVVLKDDPGGTP